MIYLPIIRKAVASHRPAEVSKKDTKKVSTLVSYIMLLRPECLPDETLKKYAIRMKDCRSHSVWRKRIKETAEVRFLNPAS